MWQRAAARIRRRTCGMVLCLFLLPALLLSMSAPLAAAPRADTWVVTCVECPKRFGSLTDRSLRLDAAGHSHVAYGGDHLYYAWHDGTAWHYETADAAPGVGSYASLALDAAGYPHISYQDGANEDLKYAYKDASGWHAETVDSAGNKGYYTSLALDAAGWPHISHTYYFGSVYYAYQDEQGWHLDNPAPGMEAGDTSLAVDGDGYAHIAFYNDDTERLEYVYQDAYGWYDVELADAEYSGTSLSLALDGNGDAHISYYDEGGSALKYYHGGGVSVVDSSPGVFWEDSSIALDSAGRPHISYRDGQNGSLKVAYHDAQGWHKEVVGTGQDTSLALDNAGRAHVSYLDDGALKYASESGLGWTIGTVDVGGRAVSGSLALDGAGGVHIAYQDAASADLKYASHDASGWHVETVDADGRVGWSPSLAIDSNGYPHIAYADATNSVVKYAHKTAAGWQIEVVVPEINLEVDLALDSQNRPHLVYPTSAGPTYAYHDGTGWQAETIGPAEPYSVDFSLALDSSGNPYVTCYRYVDFTQAFFSYASREGGTWQIQDVENVSAIVGGADIVVDGAGVPYFAYVKSGPYGQLPWDLVVGHPTDSGWSLEVVDSDNNSPALALDSSGGLHIAYGARYGYRDGTGWHVATAEGVTGYARSLQMDAAGRPHLALDDGTHLWYATMFNFDHALYLPLVVRGTSQ